MPAPASSATSGRPVFAALDCRPVPKLSDRGGSRSWLDAFGEKSVSIVYTNGNGP